METGMWVQGVGEVQSLAKEGKGVTLVGKGFSRYFGLNDPALLVGVKVGDYLKFRCLVSFNEYEKSWRIGAIYTCEKASAATAKAG